MSKDKSTGKKLADMMYGNPEGAAFGIYPKAGKRSEDKQDREAAKNFPVDLARGVVAGAVGMPGDIESLIRMLPGLNETTVLPTSEDVLKRIPLGSDSPTGRFASGLGTLIGGSAPVGPAVQGVKALPGALQTAARNVSAPRTLDSQAGVVRVGRPSAPQMEALRLAQKRAALPIEQGGLGLPANNTPEQRAAAMGINTDAYHGTKQDITGAFRPGYDDNLAFVTKSPEFANKWIGKGKLQQRAGEQAQQEVKSAEDAYRNIKLQTMHRDDALERLTGEEFNKEYDLRSAIARAEAEKEFGSPGYPDKIHSTVYPLKVEANRTFNPETDMDVMAEFFEKNDIPPKVQELYASGNYMMYETKPVVEFLKSKGYDSMRLRESTGDDYPTIAVFNPETTRSRFAAFDPFRKDVATAAAMGVLAPDLLAEEAPSQPVHFSDNPDVMALELQAGGLVKGIKAAAKAAKEPAQAPMKASEALGRIEGRPLVITQTDRTKVGGGFLGGPGFSSLQLTEPEYRAAEAAWGVKTPGVAKMILGGGKKAGPDPVYTTFIGTPTQHQSNQMVFDKLYGDFKKSAKKGGLDPELKEKINYRLANAVDKDGRPIFPPDVDILDKNFKDLATTFDQRAVTSSLIGGLGVGGKKGQIVDYDKIIRNTTDPALLDVPTGALGNRLFTLSGGIIDRPDLHPAFPTILQGEDLGVSFEPVIRDLVMKDFIEKTMREKGRPPGYMDYTRGHPPSQLITEDILTEMQKLGKKKGGAVNKAEGGEITADDLILEERKL